MLKQLRIQNFKGWEDTGTIRMAPISLFFGVNGSGKSSISQFLMMLKQTMESPDRKAVFCPDPENKLAFEYRWALPKILKVRDPVTGRTFSGETLSFHAEVGLGGEDDRTLILNQLEYDIIDDCDSRLFIGMERKTDFRTDYKVDTTRYSLKRNKMRAWDPGAPVRFYGFPDEVVAYHQNADFVQALNLGHEKLFRSICYLGPLRTKAERLYSWAGIEPESVGYAGEHTVAAIIAARSRKISLGYKRPAKHFEEIIALKLKEMGLIEEFKVNPIFDRRQEYEVKVRTKRSKGWVDLLNAGAGVSQVLPVLVQCFYAPAGSIILMEHPEIHLHPNAQSALADVMIDVINSRENGKDRGVQLIIETHSEYFLRRLQRRIAEDVVSQGKVAAYFANIDRTPAKLESLQIDIFGNIRNWPPNFFGDEMADIIGQAKASMKKAGLE